MHRSKNEKNQQKINLYNFYKTLLFISSHCLFLSNVVFFSNQSSIQMGVLWETNNIYLPFSVPDFFNEIPITPVTLYCKQCMRFYVARKDNQKRDSSLFVNPTILYLDRYFLHMNQFFSVNPIFYCERLRDKYC